MSDATRIYLEELGNLKLDRVTKLLAGIPDGVYRAVGSAIKRAAQRGLTVGMKYAAKRYAIGENELKKYTRNINTIVRDGKSSFEVTFGYRGNLIPLIRFDSTVSKEGIVSARVLRASSKTIFDHSFKARMGSHTGIYERIGLDRFPVKEHFGPSAVHALEDTYGSRGSGITEEFIEKEIFATYDSRLEHEITRVLNGWGR